jgi:uncharacterized membrane protein
MSNLYRVLLVAHLLCVIGGFGTLAYNGLFLSLARRRGPGGMAALDINRQVSGLAELLVYGTFLFGIAAVATSNSAWKFSQGWVSAAFALFIVDVGVLHGLIKRSQREYFALAERLATSSAGESGEAAVATRTAEAAQLTAIEKRISLGWGLFNLIVVVVVVLMVFRPGA